MKKRRLVVMLVAMLSVSMLLSLTACSVDISRLQGPKEEEEIVVVEAEAVLTEAQKEIKRLENVYASGQFEATDVKSLAKLYKEEGLIKKSRDLYEVAYRVFQDEEALEELSSITVNLEEEDADIITAVKTLTANMETPEYYVEAMTTLFSEEWFSTMMPKMHAGQRNYYAEDENGALLQICVYYDEARNKNSRIFLEKNGEITVLSKENRQLQMLETGIADGEYEGAFTTWTLSTDTGEVIKEEGTYSKGRFVGDYIISLSAGAGETELASMWNLRDDLIMTTYYGSFGEDGAALAKQLEDTSIIIYAYTEDGNKYLSVKAPLDENGVPIETGSYLFGAETFGLPLVPVPNRYEINVEKQDMVLPGEESIPTIKPTEEPRIAVSELQVRIFDGEIQIFDGTRWISFGQAESYAKEDIIAVMEAGKATATPVPELTDEPQEDTEPTLAPTSGRDQGIVATPTPKPTQKPVVTPKPVKTPEPTPEPTPKPSDNHDNDDDDDDDDHDDSSSSDDSGGDSSNSGSDSGNSGDSGGSSSDSGSSGGGGQDIEFGDGWSAPIL